MLSSDDLSELVAVDARPAVSLYLPTHVAGREIRQDPIRLKNLIASTAKRIRTNYPKAAAEALLAPPQALIEDENFWRHQQPGLAVFSGARFSPGASPAVGGPGRGSAGPLFSHQAAAADPRRCRAVLALGDQRGLRHGGSVMAVSHEALPASDIAAAILRY